MTVGYIPGLEPEGFTPPVPGRIVRALSLSQPYASLVVLGVKQWETRGWVCHLRERIAIHAASKFPEAFKKNCRGPFAELMERLGLTVDTLPLGKIIGSAVWLDCQTAVKVIPVIDELERMLGDYTPGRYGHKLGDPVSYPTEEQVAMRAFQRFWFLPPSINLLR